MKSDTKKICLKLLKNEEQKLLFLIKSKSSRKSILQLEEELREVRYAIKDIK